MIRLKVHSIIANTLIQIWQHTVDNALTVKNVKASQDLSCGFNVAFTFIVKRPSLELF